MATYAGRGDPRRTMQLLWRDHAQASEAAPARGPRPALSVDAIVAAAVAIADEDGLAAASMRAVGQRLGCTAMALYTYVPGKDELLDLMLDGAMLELDIPYGALAAADGWRAAASRWAQDLWAFYLRHPWVHQLSAARPVLGPGSYASMERPAEIFTGLGMSPTEVLRVVGTLSGFLTGLSRQVVEFRGSTEDTGQSEDEWWATQSSLFAELGVDVPARYPVLAAAEASGAFEFEHEPGEYLETEATHAFRFGLERLLDGISSYLASSRPG